MKKKFKKGFFAVINGKMVFIDENNKEDMKLWEDELKKRENEVQKWSVILDEELDKEVINVSKNVCGA